MGGPAMIEGGGLGTYRPEEIGPLDVQAANGVVDLVADDDADAVRLAKQYLSYFQGAGPTWDCADQRLLRVAIPENRCGSTTSAPSSHGLADTGSVLELRAGFGARDGDRAGPDRGPTDRRGGQQLRPTSAAPSTATGPTRPPASSSSATPTTSRCCSCATPPGSWSARRRSRPPRSATSAGCS